MVQNWIEFLNNAEKIVISNINNPEKWNAVEVIYSPPRVERLTMKIDNYRIHLHKIYPTDEDNSFFHFHPWECAFKMLKGGYRQRIGYGDISKDYPEFVVGEFFVGPGSMYIMDNPNSWHQVLPSDNPSFSIMVTTAVWEENKLHLDNLMNKISRTHEKAINISDSRKLVLLDEFKFILQ